MAGPYDQIIQTVADYLQKSVAPYLVVLAIAFLTTGFAVALQGRRRKGALKKALRAEIDNNAAVTLAIVTYADAQLSGGTSVAPMPTFRLRSFREYADAGLLERRPKKIAEELKQLYLSMISVNKAGRRQEDLAFGPAAAFPNAHMLRLDNLTYVRDTTHNIIEPYMDRLKDIKL
ncbi:MAG: hypothetical protein ABSB29_06625 [Nitrososphaerales archaeon]|jgi:hypothetical protein